MKQEPKAALVRCAGKRPKFWKCIAAVLSLLFCGCSARKVVQARPQGDKFWGGCEESIPASADGFAHFTCIDVNSVRWEVLLRKEPKK